MKAGAFLIYKFLRKEYLNIIRTFYREIRRTLLRVDESAGARSFETPRRKSCLSQVPPTLQEVHGIRLPRASVSTVHQV